MEARPLVRMTPKRIAKINASREQYVRGVLGGLVGLDVSLAYIAKVPVDSDRVASWRRDLADAARLLPRVRRQLRRVRATDTGRGTRSST